MLSVDSVEFYRLYVALIYYVAFNSTGEIFYGVRFIFPPKLKTLERREAEGLPRQRQRREKGKLPCPPPFYKSACSGTGDFNFPVSNPARIFPIHHFSISSWVSLLHVPICGSSITCGFFSSPSWILGSSS